MTVEHESLASALVAALAELTVVEKGRTAKIKTKNGPDYSYDYAAIEDVIKLTRPRLADHGIVALTPVHDHANGLACTVTLLHASGDRLDLGAAATAAVRTRRPEQEPISDEQRTEVNQAIAALTDDAKARLRAEWKRIPIRKLEELTVADLDRVHELIVAVETEPEQVA